MELTTRNLQTPKHREEDQSQSSLILKKSEFDQKNSQMSKTHSFKTNKNGTRFKITFNYLERLEDQQNISCLTERSST